MGHNDIRNEGSLGRIATAFERWVAWQIWLIRQGGGNNKLQKAVEAVHSDVRKILKLEVTQMAKIDEVLAGVEELDTINDSLDELFVKLSELIRAGGTDPAKLQQALDILTREKERTKAAIVANTPEAPPVEEPPTS